MINQATHTMAKTRWQHACLAVRHYSTAWNLNEGIKEPNNTALRVTVTSMLSGSLAAQLHSLLTYSTNTSLLTVLGKHTACISVGSILGNLGALSHRVIRTIRKDPNSPEMLEQAKKWEEDLKKAGPFSLSKKFSRNKETDIK